jgi:hypothetical protein
LTQFIFGLKVFESFDFFLNPNSSLKFEKQFSAAPIIFGLAHLGSPSQFSFDFHHAGPEAFGLRPNNRPTQPKGRCLFPPADRATTATPSAIVSCAAVAFPPTLG